MQEQAHRGGDLREPSIVAARRERTNRPRLMRVPVPGRAHCWSVQGNVPPRSCRLDDRAAHERLEGHLADWNHHLAGVALKPFSQRRGSTDCRREARRAVVALTASRVLSGRIGWIRKFWKNPGKTAVDRTHESVVKTRLGAMQGFQRFLIRATRNRGNPKKPEKIRVFGQSSSSTNSKIWYELAQGPLDQSWSKTSEHV